MKKKLIRKTRGKIRGKRSQVWVSDYSLSLMLFIAAALIAVKLIINNFGADTTYYELKSDATKISDILLSEGYPVDWFNGSVIRPGILDNESRISLFKTNNLMNSSVISYASLKAKLQTKYDFLIILKEANDDMIEYNSLCVAGNPFVNINFTGAIPDVDCHNPDFSSIDYKNMIRINRLAVYDSRIVKMEVYVWK
jgi:hypothetical protein